MLTRCFEAFASKKRVNENVDALSGSLFASRKRVNESLDAFSGRFGDPRSRDFDIRATDDGSWTADGGSRISQYRNGSNTVSPHAGLSRVRTQRPKCRSRHRICFFETKHAATVPSALSGKFPVLNQIIPQVPFRQILLALRPSGKQRLESYN